MLDIDAAIDEIKNERDKEIAKQIFVDDREYESIAEEFGLTCDYIYTIKNRIIKQLKNILNEYC